MTRFKFIPWLAIPALLALGAVQPTAAAASSDVSPEEGLIYLPVPGQAVEATHSTILTTSATGEVRMAQHGGVSGLVANRGRFLAVRFEVPVTAPYTIASLSFDSWVQIPNPAVPFASFRSVRLLGADASGNPDKTQTLFRQNVFHGSNNGGNNVIPLGINVTSPGKVFYAVFDFPTPTSGVADTFPFVSTDRNFTDAGLFLNSFASDTAFATGVPPAVGTLVGTTQLADQNIHAELNLVASASAPFNPPTNLGLNLRDGEVDFYFERPQDRRTDGTNGHWNSLELVRRDGSSWTSVATTTAGVDVIILPSVAAGTNIYAVRSAEDGSSQTSWTSNVVVTGPWSAVVAMSGAFGEDADEGNGAKFEGEPAPLVPPIEGRSESIWPAGDVDYYEVFAHGGDIITATASPTNIDFRNDLDPFVTIQTNGGNALAFGVASSAGEPATASVTAPGSKAQLKRYLIRVEDKAGSELDPGTGGRVLVPPTYALNVDVQTLATLVKFGPQDAPVSSLLDPDQFAFANIGANPVRGGNASLGYVIPRSMGNGTSVKLRIFDVRGRMVKLLDSGFKNAGTHFAAWSGHDSRGNRMSPGAYFARLEAGAYSRTVRIDLLQ